MRFFGVGHVDFFFKKTKKKLLHLKGNKASRSFEVSFFSALWMVSSVRVG